MKNRTVLAALAVMLAAPLQSAELDPRLAPLAPLVGKTWRGEMSPPGAEKPVVDVSRFEVALNGRAIRSLHSINDGVYGGETLFARDDEKKAIVYTYFTTGGFYTVGTVTPAEGELRWPLVVFPRSAAPGERALALRGCAERYLPQLGSVLFRGFGVEDQAAFQRFGPSARSVVAGWNVPAPTSMS